MKQQIENIKEKLVKIQYHLQKGASFHSFKKPLNSCLTKAEINNIEKEYNVVLPEAYKFFLMEIGNGVKDASFRSTFQLFPFIEGVRFITEQTRSIAKLNKPFPLCQPWVMSMDDFEADCKIDSTLRDDWKEIITKGKIYNLPLNTSELDGCIGLQNEGCGCFYFLVITGNKKGEVWFFGPDPNDNTGDYLYYPEFNNFLDWYESLIDKKMPKD